MDTTQESDLEQEDSNNLLTDSEQCLCERQETTLCASDLNIKDEECNKNKIPEMKLSKQDKSYGRSYHRYRTRNNLSY